MYTPFKMKGKSPMMKKLVGNQHRLPEHLKAKIEAAPESAAKMKKKSAAKMAKKSPVKDYKKSLQYRLMGKAGRAKMDAKYSAGEKTKLQKDINSVTSKIDKGIQTVLNNPRGKQRTGENKYVPPKKGTGTTNTPKKEKKTPGKIDWKSAPAVGTKKRTQWYKDNNLKLDDTTPALMKKSAAKMKKAPAKMKKAAVKMKKSAMKLKKESATKMKKAPAKLIKKKTDREKLNKLVEKRTKLNKKKDEREAKGKKTKRVTRRIERVQDKINKNPKAQEDRKNAPKPMDKMNPKPMNEKRTPRSRRNSFVRGAVKKK